jgi:hypothetical protein
LELELAVTASYADALNPSPSIASSQEISQRRDRMSNHLKTRCEGLLEIHDLRDRHWEDIELPYYDHPGGNQIPTTAASQVGAQRVKADLKVTYLHRTVRDFLAVDSVRGILLDHTDRTAFEPRLSILMGYTLNLKKGICSFYSKAPVSHDHLIWTVMSEVLLVAHKAPPGWAYTRILEEFNVVAFHWAENPYPGWRSFITWNPADWQATVMSAAVVLGLVSFVEKALIKNPGSCRSTSQTPFLAYALGYTTDLMFDPLLNPLKDVNWPLCPPMVNLLLRHGANPNEINEKCTRTFSVWDLAVYSYFFALYLPGSKENKQQHAWEEIVKMMLEHGADRDIRNNQNHHLVSVSGWEGSEYSLITSYDDHALLPLVNKLRIEKGMGPISYLESDMVSSEIYGSREGPGELSVLPPKRRSTSPSQSSGKKIHASNTVINRTKPVSRKEIAQSSVPAFEASGHT